MRQPVPNVTNRLRATGWTEQQIASLDRWKHLYSLTDGNRVFSPAERQRLMFAAWLYQRGRLSE